MSNCKRCGDDASDGYGSSFTHCGECAQLVLHETEGELIKYKRAEDDRAQLAASAMELRARLQRFREREPLVRELALSALHNSENLEMKGCVFSAENLRRPALAVRAFVLQPENSALDPEGKTGDKPGAVSGHTSQAVENAVDCHLSSVVEQRFRKPADSPETADGSDAKPVYAGDEVERALCRADAYDCEDALGPDAVVLAAEVRRLRELCHAHIQRAGRLEAAQPPAASPVELIDCGECGARAAESEDAPGVHECPDCGPLEDASPVDGDVVQEARRLALVSDLARSQNHVSELQDEVRRLREAHPPGTGYGDLVARINELSADRDRLAGELATEKRAHQALGQRKRAVEDELEAAQRAHSEACSDRDRLGQQLRTALDAGEAAELRIVELRKQLNEARNRLAGLCL